LLGGGEFLARLSLSLFLCLLSFLCAVGFGLCRLCFRTCSSGRDYFGRFVV
jgi:hypothetical protein